MSRNIRVYKPGFDGKAYEARRAFGATFPPFSVPLTKELLAEYPKLEEALREVGAQLAVQYAAKEMRDSRQQIVGVEIIGFDFNLILG